MDRELQRLYGSIGGHISQSRHDPRERGRQAQAALQAKFERQVDPDGVLPEEERLRRAEQARRAHYKMLNAKRHHPEKNA